MLAAMQKSLPCSAMRVGVPALSCRAPRGARTVVRSQINNDKAMQAPTAPKLAALSAAASTLFAAGNVQAATELMQLAESDNRIGIIALLFLPVIGWVGFNILQPALNQFNNMSNKRSIATGLGLAGATLLAAGNAEAATQLYQLAESDNRIGIIALLFLPVVGWVGFNILQPALNQFTKMNAEREERETQGKGGRRRGIAAGLGLTGAGLLAGAPGAEAAMEVAQVADSDVRLGVLAFIFLPALAWVAFNIAAPAKNQLDKMSQK